MFFFKHHFRMSGAGIENADPILNQNENPPDAHEEATGAEDGPPAKRRRFETSNTDYEWELPTDMANYLSRHILTFIKPSVLKETITDELPIPTNLGKVKVLDESLKELLKEAGKKSIVDNDETLFHVQKKFWDIMGPFCQIWAGMELDKESIDSNPDTPEEIVNGMNSASTLFEKTVTLMGQSFNHLIYQRRFAILSAVFNDKSRAKNILKDWKDLLDLDPLYLFGEKFEEKVIKTQKAKNKTKQLLKESAGSTSRRIPNNVPFRGAPHPPRLARGGRGRGFQASYRSFQNNSPNYGSRGARGKSNKSSFISNDSISRPKSCSSSFEKPCVSPIRSNNNTVSREIRVFSPELGKGYKGSSSFGFGLGLRNSVFSGSTTKSKATSSSSKNEQGRGRNNLSGGGKPVTERGCGESIPNSWPNFKYIVYSKKEGQGSSSSHKSEILKHPHSISPFQNGGFTLAKGSFGFKRFYGQTRFEGRLLLGTIRIQFQEVCEIRVERSTLPISLPVLWPGSGSKAVYKTFESANHYFEKVEHTSDHLSGRFIADGEQYAGDTHGKGYCDSAVTVFGSSDKYSEISTRTISGDGIPGSEDKLSEDGVDFTIRESRQNSESVSGITLSPVGKHSRLDKSVGKTDVDCSSCFGSSTALSENPKEPDQCLDTNRFLPDENRIVRRGKTGAEVVDGESTPIKRKVPTQERPGYDLGNRCFQERLGSKLPGREDRWALGPRGVRSSYKHTRIEGSSPSHKDFHIKEQISEMHSSSNGQHLSFSLHSKDGGYSERSNVVLESGTVGLSSFQRDHDYCRIFTRKAEWGSRLGVEKCGGFKRVEIGHAGVQENNRETRVSLDRPVCIQSVTSDSSLCVLEEGSILSKRRCFSTNLERGSQLCLSPVLSDRSCAGQSYQGASRDDPHNSVLAGSGLVSEGTPGVCGHPSTHTVLSETPDQSSGEMSSADSGRKSDTSGLACFRRKLETEGISGKAATLISNARRKGSISNYESAWGRWASWAHQRKIDPVSCAIGSILDFLAELFDKNLQYNTICTYRSAISAYHEPIGGLPIGQNMRVSSLMTGIFNLRPPLPRYSFVWDVCDVLTYLRSLPDDDSISLKNLTLKLASLLAIASASRASEICYLDTRYLVKGKKSYEFHFTKLTKSWRRGKPRPKLSFDFFDEEPALCVCRTIDKYLERLAQRREEESTQLLLSHIKPHQPVAICTVSRWFVEVLKASNVDTKMFSGHSTRYASTSKAKSIGIPLDEIIKRGQWSSDSMFKQRYCQEVKRSDSYQKELFKKALNKEG